VMIWGYGSDTKKWEVHVIDFKDLIGRQCGGQIPLLFYLI